MQGTQDGIDIPTSIDGIDGPWMTRALGRPIARVEHEQVGMGVGVSSTVYRSVLDGDPDDRVIVKLPALAEEAVFTSTVLRMYHREVRFFASLAAESPIRVPAGHAGAVSEDGSAFVQVMEDLGSLRTVDQIEGMAVADAERAIDELAGWHAHWWGAAAPIVDRGDAVSLADPIYPAVLPMVFAEGWATVRRAMPVAAEIEAVAPRWGELAPGLLASMAAAPATLLHGDYRADNILFQPDGAIVLLDFQLTGAGSGAYDLAYFVTQSLTSEDAATHETALFNRWRDGLIAAGVPEAETAGQWDRYREAALFCLVYPIVAARGMDFSDERQYDLVDRMNTRFARAVDQLQLADLL